MRKAGVIYGALVFALMAEAAGACEFCTLHNGLGQYNNQGDFLSLTYRDTYASTAVGGEADPAGYNITIKTIQLYYQHAFSDNLKGVLSVPYYDKSAKAAEGSLGSASGIGDIIAMARYTVWSDFDRFFAVLAGVKLPTGSNKKEAETGAMSPDLVLGTGSADPLLGAVYNHNIQSWNLSIDALYKISNTGYDGYRFGSVLNLGAGGYYKLHDNFNAGLGFAGEITAKDNDSQAKVTGEAGTIANTGGTVVFAQPTIQYTNANFYAEVAYQAPVYRSFNGTQIVVDKKLIFSLRYAF